ncbi:hypothetical protein MAR_038510 [Mya arenaria]|uniref:Uncharacterized protein n=1 Tax=Mya arenaria TaxID=6604 RepID=A0ABY7FVH3_MYAAR|nr:hypothetical protein MAR_038510 [Mya arenaria]
MAGQTGARPKMISVSTFNNIIKWNYDKIEKNPGIRSLAKLMLNMFRGKVCQQTNLTKTTYISDPSEFFDMTTSDQQQVKNVRIIIGESVQ